MHNKGDVQIASKVLLGLMLGIFITIILLAPLKLFWDKLKPDTDTCDNSQELQKIVNRLTEATETPTTVALHNTPCVLVTFARNQQFNIFANDYWGEKINGGKNLLCLCPIKENRCNADRNACIELNKPINEEQYTTNGLSEEAFITLAQTEKRYQMQDFRIKEEAPGALFEEKV